MHCSHFVSTKTYNKISGRVSIYSRNENFAIQLSPDGTTDGYVNFINEFHVCETFNGNACVSVSITIYKGFAERCTRKKDKLFVSL